MSALKVECREKALATSGTKYDLVLRILQQENGTGAPKPLPGVVYDDSTGKVKVGEDGNPVVKKRTPSKKPIDLPKLEEKVLKYCYPNKDKWGNMKHKYHCTDVFQKVEKIIQKECFDKGFVERKDPFALEVARVIMVTIGSHLDSGAVSGMGRAGYQASCVASKISSIIDAVLPNLTTEMATEHSKWIKAVDMLFRIDYCVPDFHPLYGKVLQNEAAGSSIREAPLNEYGMTDRLPNPPALDNDDVCGILCQVRSTDIATALKLERVLKWRNGQMSFGPNVQRVPRPDTPLTHI